MNESLGGRGETEKKKGQEFRNGSLSEIFLYKYRKLLSERQATDLHMALHKGPWD